MTGVQRLCTENYAGTIGPCPVSSFSIPPHIPPDQVHDVGEHHTLSHHMYYIYMYLYGNEGRQCVTMDTRDTDSVHHHEVCMYVQVTWGRTAACHDQYLTCRATGDVHTHMHTSSLK